MKVLFCSNIKWQNIWKWNTNTDFFLVIFLKRRFFFTLFNRMSMNLVCLEYRKLAPLRMVLYFLCLRLSSTKPYFLSHQSCLEGFFVRFLNKKNQLYHRNFHCRTNIYVICLAVFQTHKQSCVQKVLVLLFSFHIHFRWKIEQFE